MKAILLIALILIGCSSQPPIKKETELDLKIKVFQCMYYCSTGFEFDDCKKICTEE